MGNPVCLCLAQAVKRLYVQVSDHMAVPPHVPDKVVDRGLSRSLSDNSTGIATRLNPSELSHGGDLMPWKRSPYWQRQGDRADTRTGPKTATAARVGDNKDGKTDS
jgi:hypothetical protein